MIGIAGAGAFGTALADVIATRGGEVTLWGDEPDAVAQLQATRINEKRLPGVTISEKVRVTGDLGELARSHRLLLLAVPSPRVADLARRLGDVVDGRHMIVHAVGAPGAGPNADGVGRRVSEILREETPVKRVGALAGPALARDLVERRACAVVVGSPFEEVVSATRAALNTPPTLRVYGGPDLLGVELASALSGAITVAIGLADGLGIGAGPRAVLITRAVAECGRLLSAAGAQEKTFGGLAGLGNLLVRSTTEYSDDYKLGLQHARGKPERRESEGTRAAQSGAKLGARMKVRTPILDAISSVAYGGVSVKQAAARLLETSAEEE